MINYDLQLFGGRGASSSVGGGSGAAGGGLDTKQIERDIKSTNEKAFDVDMGGSKARYIFQSKNGQHYYKRSVGANPEPTPNNMTPKEMMARAKSNGATVKEVSKKELVNMHVEYRKDRKETNDFLNRSYARNKGADETNKAYRNTLKAARLARRRT